MRGDARDRRYAHHNVGRPATGGTHVIHLSVAAAAAAVAALAGAVVHELARPAQSGSRRAGRGRLLKLVHVVVVAVARSSCVHFDKQTPFKWPLVYGASNRRSYQRNDFSMCRYSSNVKRNSVFRRF